MTWTEFVIAGISWETDLISHILAFNECPVGPCNDANRIIGVWRKGFDLCELRYA